MSGLGVPWIWGYSNTMDQKKAVGALTAGAWLGGIMFAVFLIDHLIGKPPMPPWGIGELLRGAFWSIILWVVGATISYIYQVAQERRSKSKL